MSRNPLAAFALIVVVYATIVGCANVAEVTTEESGPAVTSSTTQPPGVSFIVPVGTGEGQIAYEDLGRDPWGPTSFCVLPDKSVAILDGGNLKIQVFDHSGGLLDSIDLTGIAISPLDIRWWNDAFAITEASSQPASVILIEASGEVRQTIDLWLGLALSSAGGLRVGQNGELGVLEANTWIHMLTDGRGNVLPLALAATREPTLAFQGGPEFVLSTGDSGVRARVGGSSEWVIPVPGGVGGSTPLSSDGSGNTYFVDSRQSFGSSVELESADKLVVRLDSSFRQVSFATVDLRGRLILPSRMVDVTSDGNAYSMVPMADGVHVNTLAFSAALPELSPGDSSSPSAP